MAVVVKKIIGAAWPTGLGRATPLELANDLDGVAPAGTPIMSTCFIVEKMDVAVSDGRNGWYLQTDGGVKSIKAGAAWADLF